MQPFKLFIVKEVNQNLQQMTAEEIKKSLFEKYSQSKSIEIEVEGIKEKIRVLSKEDSAKLQNDDNFMEIYRYFNYV